MPICILPVRPGTDLALLMGMLHVIIRDGLRGPAVHRSAHHRLGRRAEMREASRTPQTAAEMTRRAARNRSRRRRTGSRRPTSAIAMHARGLEHQSKGVENCLAVINHRLATGNIGAKARAAR